MKYGMKLLIHSKISKVQQSKFAVDKQFHPSLYYACEYLAMLGIRFTHVSKRDPVVLVFMQYPIILRKLPKLFQ